jgi:hypothetical protein
MIGSRELDLMKRSAYPINVARAQIVDRDSLYRSLLNRDIAGAALELISLIILMMFYGWRTFLVHLKNRDMRLRAFSGRKF